MADDRFSSYVGKKFIGLSLVLTLIFWCVMTRLLLPFVPGADTLAQQYFFAGFTATCLSGVFFLALYMFRLVQAENSEAKKSK
jgi:hypothetical protein